MSSATPSSGRSRRRLRGTVRSSDTVARIGGDEFVIVLETLGGRLDARSVADKVLASVAKPVTLQRHMVKTTVSIGISFYPDNSGDAEALVRAADYAMYLAKSRGKEQLAGLPQGSPRTGHAFPAEAGSRQLLGRRRFLNDVRA